jgi:DUF1680 family protein
MRSSPTATSTRTSKCDSPESGSSSCSGGHELYCAGHLIQAAVALHRTTGDPGLLEVARRTADLIVDRFGTEAGKVDGVCGHPEIETAPVELYRETGAEPYLERARHFIDRRGHELLGDGRFGRHYWQDHLPVRDAASVEGHVVPQLYLLAGVADVYLTVAVIYPPMYRCSRGAVGSVKLTGTLVIVRPTGRGPLTKLRRQRTPPLTT